MRPHLFAATLCAVAYGFTAPAFAESEPVHPMIDFPPAGTLPALEEMNITELEQHRAIYTQQVVSADATPPSEQEAALLQALLRYDDERVRIVEIIPQLIELYEVDEELAEDMMNFRKTLSGIIEELRPNITTLQSYKPYDFRLGVSYIVLMNTLHENEQVRERMQQDQQNPDSLLGRYTRDLQTHYREVEDARGALEASYRTEELQKFIHHIDTELSRRGQS